MSEGGSKEWARSHFLESRAERRQCSPLNRVQPISTMSIEAYPVPEHARIEALPRHFGRHMLTFERRIYAGEGHANGAGTGRAAVRRAGNCLGDMLSSELTGSQSEIWLWVREQDSTEQPSQQFFAIDLQVSRYVTENCREGSDFQRAVCRDSDVVRCWQIGH